MEAVQDTGLCQGGRVNTEGLYCPAMRFHCTADGHGGVMDVVFMVDPTPTYSKLIPPNCRCESHYLVLNETLPESVYDHRKKMGYARNKSLGKRVVCGCYGKLVE